MNEDRPFRFGGASREGGALSMLISGDIPVVEDRYLPADAMVLVGNGGITRLRGLLAFPPPRGHADQCSCHQCVHMRLAQKWSEAQR